jgi:hypothetical protein
VRLCFDPAGLARPKVEKKHRGHARLKMDGSLGSFVVDLSVDESRDCLVRFTTSLTPCEETRIEPGPRDICLLDAKFNPLTRPGPVYVEQAGPTAGLAYLSFPATLPATVIYFQNLSALSPFCDLVHADPSGSVAVEWPEAGYAIPKTEKPLRKGEATLISDAFISIQESVPSTDVEIAENFLESMAQIYRAIEKPATEYYNWPAATDRTLRALAFRDSRRRIKGRTFLNAYIGSTEKPPESMVQLAVLLPMLEYQKWARTKVRLADELLASIPRFFDKELGMLRRWLPGTPFGAEADSEEEDHGTMDSWYFFHTLLNLARLAELGLPGSREMLVPSLEYAMRIGHHFKYRWPVFFDPKSLAVIKAETQPGEGGEQDVPGLYVHVMLQAYELTRDQRYLAEAEEAARRIEGLGFKLLYQTNNTIMSAIALTKLWKATANRRYLDLGTICVANVIARMWIWNGEFGFAKDGYDTFMGVAPLQDAEYVAAYEEHEFFAAVVNYLKTAAGEVPAGVDLILSEYAKYLLHRGRYYFCDELPAKAIAEKPKEGKIRRELFLPLEDLRTGWSQSGQVGQEVYGSAASFILTSYAYVNKPDVPFLVHAEYPVLHSDFRLLDRRGEVNVTLSGRSGRCRVHLIAKGAELPRHELVRLSDRSKCSPLHTGRSRAEFEVDGGERYRVIWVLPKTKRSRK